MSVLASIARRRATLRGRRSWCSIRQEQRVWGDIDCPHYFEAHSEPAIRKRLRQYAAATVLGLRLPPLPGVTCVGLACQEVCAPDRPSVCV